MKKTYIISDDNIHDAVIVAVKKIMKGQTGWKKDSNLDLLEFAVEGGIRSALSKIKEIKLS